MANAGASIEAVLTLNASGFTDGITKSTNALNSFINATDKLKSGSASKGIDQLSLAFDEFHTVLQKVDSLNRQSINTFSKVSSAINKMANGLRILQSEDIDVVQGVNTMNNIFKAFQGTLNGTTVKLEGVVTAQRQVATSTRTSIEAQMEAIATLNSNRNATMQLITGENQLSASEKQVASATTQESVALEKDSVTKTKNVASTNQLTSATNRLKSAMSSLRMMGSLVGSMLAYNFAHKLLVATGETIHAKSEMEGYFKMLNFGQRDIANFNRALDKTVAQFQRVNKYALGETISSIGVEFNLSTKEMEKAMPVVSMITSEYLRAGRNVNEASLAVKDILQGEFQRLSRETGVKGKQLEEAGWSGDKSDVMGLLEALDKVGKSRNWDVFAEKANSLNDILTIIQNRFGEWSADVVYSVQPAIVGAFNMILGSAQKLASVLTGVWEWLNGDSIEGQVAKWSLLATAITTVVGAFISYRTGAGLLQIVQMGLSGTIASTVLGLEAETVATYGTKTAIMSKIMGVEAEKVAELSVRDAILSKVLGLDTEVLAETNLKEAILTTSLSRELETMKLEGATEKEFANTIALYENNLAHESNIKLLLAQMLKLDMTTYATHGFTVALIEANTGMKASQIASMSLAQKIVLLGASFVVPTAIVGAFAVAVGLLALKMNDSAKAMENFNDLIENGQSTIKENKEIVEQYTARQDALEKKLSETTKGTAKYIEIQNELRAVNQDITTSNENLKNSIQAVQIANSSQKHYEERLTDMSIEHQGKLAEAYMNAGYSAKESYEMANESLIDAQNGAEQLRITLQKIKQLQGKGEENTNYLLGVYKENGVDLNDEETKKHLNEAVSLNDKMQKAMEKGLTDESFMGRIDGWFSYYQYQLEAWINNIGATFQSGDWGAIFENVWKGIAHGFADLPFIKDFWKWIYDQIGVTNYAGQGWDAFGNMFNDFFNWLFEPSNWLDNNDPVSNLGKWFSESLASGIDSWFEPLKDLDLLGMIWDALTLDSAYATDGESSDHPSFMDDVSAIMGFDVQAWIDSFMADPLGTLGITAPSLDLSILFDGLFGATGGLNLGEWLNSIFDISGWISSFTSNLSGIVSSVTDTASTVVSSFDSMKNTVSTNINNIVTTATQGFQNAYNNAKTSLTNMRDTTSQVVTSMVSAWNRMKDSILDCAKQIWDGVTKRFSEIGDTIKGFYQKIQNPSQWGSSGSASLRSGTPKPSTGRAVARTITGRGYSGGRGSAPTGTMTISSLKRMLCPDGNCGNLFDGFNGSDVVDVPTFLALVGDGHGFGGWNFSDNHLSHIRTTTNKWDTGSPVINLLSGIATSTKFKVGEFEDGTPKISWEAFQSMAQAIFSAIPYRFYYDSSWKGSWLGALEAGACNCYDGALALIAFANACGFGGSMEHGTWTDPDGTQYPHVWAVINGKKMDTTAWQQRGSWSAGSPTVSSRPLSNNNNKTPVTINITMGDVYGVDDLNRQIEDGIDKGLQKHFNDSYALGV